MQLSSITVSPTVLVVVLVTQREAREGKLEHEIVQRENRREREDVQIACNIIYLADWFPRIKISTCLFVEYKDQVRYVPAHSSATAREDQSDYFFAKNLSRERPRVTRTRKFIRWKIMSLKESGWGPPHWKKQTKEQTKDAYQKIRVQVRNICISFIPVGCLLKYKAQNLGEG